MLIYPEMKRVVITGIGAVTPLGNDIETTWGGLTKGISGLGHITKFDASGLPGRIAGELKKFTPENYISRKDILRLDPFIHYAVAAAIMAAEDAGIISAEERKSGSAKAAAHCDAPLQLTDAGVVIGSSRGGITGTEKALEKHFMQGRAFSAYVMPSSTINMAASCVSIRLGAKGPALGVSTACASGTSAIGEAARMIRHGEIPLAFAGGAEAPLCRLAVGGYGASGALSKRNHEPDKASRPFDRDRDGFVIAEGAAVLVLEEFDHALKRDARMYAELSGYGASSDAFHQTKPSSEGEAGAIKKALDDARVGIDRVDFINAHATSTPLGDAAEAEAIKKVFGRYTRNIHVSSCKSMSGHMLGAAGALEAAATALSISRNIITPTINLENPDPDCDLNFATSAINKETNVAVSNSFGFGGVNAVLVLKKVGV